MSAATVVQQLCKSCRTCFMFYCMFYLTCDRSFSLIGRVWRHVSAAGALNVDVQWWAMCRQRYLCPQLWRPQLYLWVRAVSARCRPRSGLLPAATDLQHSVYQFAFCLFSFAKGAITSKIQHAIKLKTSRARLAQLWQPSFAFSFSSQPMTTHCTVQAKTKC